MSDSAKFATRTDLARLRESVEDAHERTGRRITAVEREYKGDHDRLTTVTGIGPPVWTCALAKQRADDHDARIEKMEGTVGKLEHTVIRASVRGGGVVAGAIATLAAIIAGLVKVFG